MKKDLELVLASELDLGVVQAILSESGRWMREARGVLDQWPERFPDWLVLEAIRAREMFLVYRDNECIGTVRIQESDEAVWGPDDRQALYVHSLAVRRSLKGQGLGQAILDEVQKEAARRSKRFLRLDCIATNESLRRFYERCGFVYRRNIMQTNAHGPRESRLYER
ncbi:GNAT family N-acetyltransferase [Candidatus Parcubacteria bacterium]|nr:GNAT family N-acetyltransferase [Candidatus Parcubacteria bacterium]